MDRDSKKLSTAMSDPIMQQIKSLSHMNSDEVLMERAQLTESKLNAVLLPEEWLELSYSYLTLPPTLTNPTFETVLQVRL